MDALINLFSNLPVSILSILCLIVIIFLIFKKEIVESVKNLQRPKTKKKIDSLIYHRFFTVCDEVERIILGMSFITKGAFDKTKTKMMHTLIQMKCATMKKHFTKLLLSPEIDSWGHLELQAKFKFTLMEVVKDYNEEALTTYVKWGIDYDDANFLINTYEEYRACMVSVFIDGIDSILMNTDYEGNFNKVNTLMETCCIAIGVIPRDVQSSFEAVNGRFAKYKI